MNRMRRIKTDPLLRSAISALFIFAGVCRAQVVISEFMADNDSTLTDGFGNYSDWIEIYNPANIPVYGFIEQDKEKSPDHFHMVSIGFTLFERA